KHFKHNHPDRWDELIKIVNKTNIKPYNADKILQINQSLVKWIITDQQAFLIVENKDFQLFITELIS
ncbi:20874_t:CDS:1, partial [Cetraspora pellucida]